MLIQFSAFPWGKLKCLKIALNQNIGFQNSSLHNGIYCTFDYFQSEYEPFGFDSKGSDIVCIQFTRSNRTKNIIYDYFIFIWIVKMKKDSSEYILYKT